MNHKLVTGGAFLGASFDALFGNARDEQAVLPKGTRIDKFELIEEIGRGGGSVVYLADRCDGTFAQMVAIKVAHATPTLRARLLLERDMLGRLRHPKIAQIFDGGETDDGDIWFAMELVSGEHINRYCETHRLDWPARVALLVDVCDAVNYAHQNNVVHRDIKPNNILVDTEGHLKLMDFGIATYVEGTTTEAGDHAALTPEFASPEQFARGLITTASDIYQVGRVMEELLENAPPMPKHVARNLAAVVACATYPEPGRRYPSMAHMREDLLRTLKRLPAQADPGDLAYRLELLVRRNARTCLLLLLALTCIALAAYWQYQVSAEGVRANAEATRHQSTRDFVRELMAQTDPYSMEAEESMASLAMLRAAAKRIQSELSDAPEVRAELSGPVATGLLRLGSVPEAQEVIDQGVELARRLPSLPSDSLARLLNVQASIYFDSGQVPLSDATYREALALLPSDTNLLLPERAESLSGLARNANRRGDHRTALATYEQALQLRKDSLGIDHADYAMNLQDIGSTWYYIGEYQQAERSLVEAASRLEKSLGPEHPRLAYVWGSLGAALRYQGRYEEAIEIVSKARALQERTKTTQPRAVGTTRTNLGELYRLVGLYDEALRESGEGYEILRLAGANHAVGALFVHARTLLDVGRYADAEQKIAQARAELPDGNEARSPVALRVDALEAILLHRMGNTGRALERARTILAGMRTQPDVPAGVRSDVLLWIAEIVRAEDRDEACGLYGEVIELATSLGEADANVKSAGEALKRLGCRAHAKIPHAR